MKEPVDHIERPRIPWRSPPSASITECGYDASKVKTVTRAEFFARFVEYGERRMALLTCMTCMDTARRWGTWDQNPFHALEREMQWERRHKGDVLKAELFAIVMLIRNHPDEFQSLLKDAAWWGEVKAKPLP